jgi:hypothetical protein
MGRKEVGWRRGMKGMRKFSDWLVVGGRGLHRVVVTPAGRRGIGAGLSFGDGLCHLVGYGA